MGRRALIELRASLELCASMEAGALIGVGTAMQLRPLGEPHGWRWLWASMELVSVGHGTCWSASRERPSSSPASSALIRSSQGIAIVFLSARRCSRQSCVGLGAAAGGATGGRGGRHDARERPPCGVCPSGCRAAFALAWLLRLLLRSAHSLRHAAGLSKAS